MALLRLLVDIRSSFMTPIVSVQARAQGSVNICTNSITRSHTPRTQRPPSISSDVEQDARMKFRLSTSARPKPRPFNRSQCGPMQYSSHLGLPVSAVRFKARLIETILGADLDIHISQLHHLVDVPPRKHPATPASTTGRILLSLCHSSPEADDAALMLIFDSHVSPSMAKRGR